MKPSDWYSGSFELTIPTHDWAGYQITAACNTLQTPTKFQQKMQPILLNMWKYTFILP